MDVNFNDNQLNLNYINCSEIKDEMNNEIKDEMNNEINNEINKIITNIIEEIIIYNDSNNLYQEIKGGLGNQLCLLLNILSLASKYNMNYILSLNTNFFQTHPYKKYNFFKNIEFKENIHSSIIDKHFYYYNEKNLSYKEILFTNESLKRNKKNKNKEFNNLDLDLNKDKDNINNINNINKINKNIFLIGYFQSYKYWWLYKDVIKKTIFIDYTLINNIKNIYEGFKKNNKKILAIHIRLRDYLVLSDKFPIHPLVYYERALAFYDLSKYQIFLFSDNIELAIEFLKPLELDYICADEYYSDDENQFYMLMLSNIRICCSSTFSLVSCYFNEIYNFVDTNDCEYVFPSVWGNNTDIKYKLSDIMINHKYIVIDYVNSSTKKLYDVVSPIHKKDLKTYVEYLSSNKKLLVNSNQFYYISDCECKEIDILNVANSNTNSNTGNNKYIQFIDENKYPFTKQQVFDYLGKYIPKNRLGWYYQQLLKLYIFRLCTNDNEIKLKNYVLILDSDLLLLKPFFLFNNKKKPIIHYLDHQKEFNNKMKLSNQNEMKLKNIHKPYVVSMNYLMPKLNINVHESGVIHHMLFHKKILNQMLIKIEKKFNKAPWISILDSVIYYVQKFGYNISILSEYELYFHYVKNIYKENYEFRNNLKFIDTNINKFNWIAKENISFIGNHSWKK